MSLEDGFILLKLMTEQDLGRRRQLPCMKPRDKLAGLLMSGALLDEPPAQGALNT